MESDFRKEAPEGFFLTSVPFEGKKTFQTEYELLDLIGKGIEGNLINIMIIIDESYML